MNVEEMSKTIDGLLEEMYGEDPEFMPQYVILGDGAVYYYVKEEHRYALREQTPSI